MTVPAASKPACSTEQGAEALYRAVCCACERAGSEFADRIEAGISAALSFFEEDPDLSRKLVILAGDEQEMAVQWRWVTKFGRLLRDMAAGAAESTEGVPLREPFLIEGIRYRIGRELLREEAVSLQALRPEMREVVLAYYRQTGPARRV